MGHNDSLQLTDRTGVRIPRLRKFFFSFSFSSFLFTLGFLLLGMDIYLKILRYFDVPESAIQIV